ncbi:MAG TPA: hypothetical protein DE176_00865 [Clostridiales bacterium]|nr:hypothetical protein [Clostridiales bacterium]
MNETNQTDRFAPLFAELDRRLAGEALVRLAIEGGSASGKTTLGKILADWYGCTVFHMDDFFSALSSAPPRGLLSPAGMWIGNGFSPRCCSRSGAAKRFFTGGSTALPCSCKMPWRPRRKSSSLPRGHTPCTPTLRRITISPYFWTSPRNCSAIAFPAATRRRKRNAFLPNGSRWSRRTSPRSIFRQSARCAFPYCKERKGTCNFIILDCAAGKDRTGVVSAILLYKLGMSREYIIADFMKTTSNPEAYLAQFAGEPPGIRLDVIAPHERFMEKFLAWLSTQEI